MLRCNQSSIVNALHLPTRPASTHDLPTFEQVCHLNHPSLRFIPSKARPAFARALSLALRELVLKNTEESWLKHFMLPKCVVPSIARRGTHVPHMSIKSLCNMWLRNDLSTLWAMAINRTIIPPSKADTNPSNTHRKRINSAVSLGRSGLMNQSLSDAPFSIP